jgi:hypothetical protein
MKIAFVSIAPREAKAAMHRGDVTGVALAKRIRFSRNG